MDLSRRGFLKACGSSAAVFTVPLIGCSERQAQEPGIQALLGSVERKQAFANVALGIAKQRGATFADVRIVQRTNQMLVAKDNEVVGVGERIYGAWPNWVGEKIDIGFNVRVLKNGAWGFAASPMLTDDECRHVAGTACDLAERAARSMPQPITLVPEPAHVDSYETPHELDPFSVPADEKLALLFRINERVRQNKHIDRVYSWLDFWDDRKYYANSEGASIDQRIVRSDGSYVARAMVNGQRAQRRYFLNPLNIGYEYIRRSKMVDEAERIAAEAVEKASAPGLPTETRTPVIMDPQNICLLQHESIGHPTELNRTMLVEINFAGSTFLTPGDLGTYQFGPKIMNVVADRSRPTHRATCGYDDEGVKTQQWDIVREGVLVGFQTTRDFAGYIHEPKSRGCCLSESWDRVPQARIPNLGLEGADGGPSPEELIADTKHGLLFSGYGIFIVQDHQRRNHTYTGNAVWEIKNGKKARMLRDVYYQGDNPREIWQVMDAVTNRASWEPAALDSDDIGQPTQRNQNTHGAPWARFQNMTVGGPAI